MVTLSTQPHFKLKKDQKKKKQPSCTVDTQSGSIKETKLCYKKVKDKQGKLVVY